MPTGKAWIAAGLGLGIVGDGGAGLALPFWQQFLHSALGIPFCAGVDGVPATSRFAATSSGDRGPLWLQGHVPVRVGIRLAQKDAGIGRAGRDGGLDWSTMSTQELLSRLGENVSVRRAFGPAYEKGELLIIPVALVLGGGGGGDGLRLPPPSLPPGPGPAELANGADRRANGGLPAGSGAGFGGLIMPVGVYVVKGEQVRWVPVVDATVVVLASLSVIGALAGLRRRARRHQHR